MTPAPDLGPAGRLLQRLTWAICRAMLRLEVDGRERLAVAGAAVLVFNHLSIADGPLIASLLPRKGVFLIAREFDRIPVLNWWIRALANPIYIERGAPDRRSVARALAVLEGGGLLCLSPEGRVSRGGLGDAQRGAAFLAKTASATVVPLAAYGQERFYWQWLRLRRPRVRVVVGEPFTLPHDRSRDNTDVLMRRIAVLLPPEYQGVYRR